MIQFSGKTKSKLYGPRRLLTGVSLAVLTFVDCTPAFAQSVQLMSPPQLLSPPVYATVQREPHEPVTSQWSASPSGIFNSGVIFIADQLDRLQNSKLRTRPTVTTSFANLNDLAETSGFGRLVGEHLMHELQVRAWSVVDIRLTKDLVVNEKGEFSLSRDMKHLRDSYPLANIVTGTYSVTGDGLLLNVRIIDSASGQVIATAQTRFLRDRFINSLLENNPVAVATPMIKLTAACPVSLACPLTVK